MERAISAEERIRRAEEIYLRRKMNTGVRVSSSNVNINAKPKLEYKLYKKLILQIAICLLIYFIFYLIKNSNYIFSENVISKTREFLSYDINFQNLYYQGQDYYNKHIKAFFEKEENTVNETINEIVNETVGESTVNEEVINQNVISEEKLNEEQNNTVLEGGIGGGEDETNLVANEVIETSSDEEEMPLTQMEIDANEIKQNYSLILPLRGTVTSRFGPRTPTEIVSANHAGIDIGVNEGTVFIASMEGTVTSVSSQGGYGNHVYIQNGDVITLYAHCKTIYVKKGDKISQGQKIGEVGQTGNATGPHLHFEIRKQNRVVNPELILNF